MSVKEIAAEAIKMFAYSSDELKSVKMDVKRSALLGFFRGIVNGNITTGQEWPIDILLNHIPFETKEEFLLLEKIFESGICSRVEIQSGRHSSPLRTQR